MGHKNNYDFLRFLFAFIVLVRHSVILLNNSDLSFLNSYFDTHIAVTGFFIISGCLITNSFIRTSTTKKYFIKRARRLLPAYIFIILVCAAGLSLVSTLPLGEYFKNPQLYKYLAANLSFANFLQPSLPGVFAGPENVMDTVNGSLWTIKVEVLFYILVPFLVLLLGKETDKPSKKVIFWFILIYAFSIIWRDGFAWVAKSNGNHIANMLAHQTPAFMCYFAAGMSLVYFKDFIARHIGILALISLPVFVVEHYFNVEYLKPMAFAALIYYAAHHFKGLNNFGKYGDFSYGIYIFHFPLIQLFVSTGILKGVNPWIALATGIITSFVFAILSWNLLEKRFLKNRQQVRA